MAVIVKDSFNRANSNNIGVTETGQPWTTDAGWQISSNQLRFSSGDYSMALVNAGVSDCIISVKNINKFNESGLSFRTTNLEWDNGFSLQQEGNNIVLFRMGTWNVLADVPAGQAYTAIKVELQGAFIKVYLDATLIINISNTHNQTATFHGITSGTVGSIFDDFLIEDFNEEPPEGTKYTKSLTESIAFTDSIINRSGSKRIIDNVSTTESKTVKTSRSFVEPLDITDFITVIPPDIPNVYTKELIDAVDFNEAFTKSVYTTKLLNDAVLADDSISKNFAIAILDQVNTSEQNSGNVDRIINDTLNINDNLAQEGNNRANLADQITITDTISKALYKLQSDNVAAGESQKEYTAKELFEDLIPVDSIAFAEGKAILLFDNLLISESINKAVHRLQNDLANLSDSIGKQSNVSVRLYDVIVSTDEINVFNPNAPQHIGSINLKGKRELYVYLVAKQSLYVELKAKRELYIHLKGAINMTMENQNGDMYSGNTKYITFPVDGVESLIGASLKWGIRKNKYSNENILVKSSTNGISIVDEQVQVKLDPDDTLDLSGTFYQECQLTDSLGNVSTVLTGELKIVKSAI